MIKLSQCFYKVICLFFVAVLMFTSVVSDSFLISSKAEKEDATIVVALDKNTLNVGDTFNVKVAYNSNLESGYLTWTLEYDSSLVSREGSAGKIIETFMFDEQSDITTNVTVSYTFTAKAVGKVSFSISATSYKLQPDDNGDEMIINASGASASIVDVGSNDASLKSLDIDGGTLVPAFSPDVTEYTVSVPFDISALYVYPKTNDTRATHTIEGDEFLNVGTKTRTVVVTAQDGTVKKYVIKITRAAKPTEAPSPTPTQVPTATPVPTLPESEIPTQSNVVLVNGKEYRIENISEDILIPEGFEKADIVYKDSTYIGAKGISKKLNLLFLSSDELSGLFVYDADNNVFFRHLDINVKSGIYTFMRLLDGEKGLNLPKTQFSIGEDVFDAYEINSSEKEFFIIRAMNWNGVIGYYTYDIVENTLQRYTDTKFKSEDTDSVGIKSSETPAPTPTVDSDSVSIEDDENDKEPKNTNGMLLILIISAGVICLVMAVFLIYFALKERKTCKIMNELSDGEDIE